MSFKLQLKKEKSKAFKNGRKVGYWLAMQNVQKLSISDMKDISVKPKKKKLSISDMKDISVKSKKKKLSISDVKDISVKPKKKKLSISDMKDVSVKPKKKPKKKLQFEQQKGISKKGISPEVKEFLKSKVPSKTILKTEHLPSINIESQALDNIDKSIQTEKRKIIDLAIEEALTSETIHPFNEDDYYDNSGPGVEAFIIDGADDEYEDELNALLKKMKPTDPIPTPSEEIELFSMVETEDEILERKLKKMLDEVKPEDPLPTAEEEEELYSML
jgi:hypothetical protein